MYQKGKALLLKSYTVTFSHAVVAVVAPNPGQAIQAAKELAGPGAQFLSCIQQGDW